MPRLVTSFVRWSLDTLGVIGTFLVFMFGGAALLALVAVLFGAGAGDEALLGPLVMVGGLLGTIAGVGCIWTVRRGA